MLKTVPNQYTTEGILPPHAYFDPKWHKLASDMVYSKAPIYLGHVSLVPDPGSYALAPYSDGKLLLLRDQDGVIRCFKNRCCHQGARLIDPTATPDYASPSQLGEVETLSRDTPQGKKKCIVCPLHQWTYGMDGNLRGAPKFEVGRLDSDRKQLKEVPVIQWNGMIWANIPGSVVPWEEELSLKSNPDLFDISDYFHDGTSVTQYGCSHLLFNNVYLDDRHVQQGHMGSFGDTMDLSELNLVVGKHFNIQEVGFVMKPKRKLCPEYAAWHEWILKLQQGVRPAYGALWSFFYPNMMIEVYPWTIVISVMVPDGPDKCRNIVEYFYPNLLLRMVERGEITEMELSQFKMKEKAAYARTAAEDVEFVMRIANGLRDAYTDGENFVGLPHPVEEQGMFLYHELYRGVEERYQVILREHNTRASQVA